MSDFEISDNGLKNLFKHLRNNRTISSKKWRKNYSKRSNWRNRIKRDKILDVKIVICQLKNYVLNVSKTKLNIGLTKMKKYLKALLWLIKQIPNALGLTGLVCAFLFFLIVSIGFVLQLLWLTKLILLG